MMELKDLPFKDLGYAKIDNHREIRVGYPEVIYGEGKTSDQIKGIVEFMIKKGNNVLYKMKVLWRVVIG